MDISVFEDELEEGQELETYCAKCKAETTHVFLGEDEDEVKRVRCSNCDQMHVLKKPNEEEIVEPKKRPAKSKPTYEQVIGKKKTVAYRLYNANEIFLEMEILQHPIFGMGFVSEMIGSDKIEVTFQKDKRILIHNKQRQPIPVDQLPTFTEKRKSNPLIEDPELNLDELLNLPEDIGAMLADEESEPFGKPSKLSAKAWAALNEEEEEEEVQRDGDEDDDDDSSTEKKKGKTTGAKSKKPTGKGTKTAPNEPALQKNKSNKPPQSGGKKKPGLVSPQNKKKAAASQTISRSI